MIRTTSRGPTIRWLNSALATLVAIALGAAPASALAAFGFVPGNLYAVVQGAFSSTMQTCSRSPNSRFPKRPLPKESRLHLRARWC